jgi:hypothetical protein
MPVMRMVLGGAVPCWADWETEAGWGYMYDMMALNTTMNVVNGTRRKLKRMRRTFLGT